MLWYISSSFIVTEFYKVETVLKRKKTLAFSKSEKLDAILHKTGKRR